MTATRFITLVIGLLLHYIVFAQKTTILSHSLVNNLPEECQSACKKAINDYVSRVNNNPKLWSEAIRELCVRKPFLDSILTVFQLPDSYAIVPLAASFMDPTYQDSFQRTGYWALSISDALSHGLKTGFVVDERRDFQASSIAGVKKLKFLYDQYNSVDSAVFHFFLEGPALHEEERQYAITKWLTWKMIYEPVQKQLLYKCSQVGNHKKPLIIKADTTIYFDCISRFCTEAKNIQKLNPVYYRGVVLKGDSFQLPPDAKSCFDSTFTKIVKCSGGFYDREKVAIVYKIRYGDNLSKIARRYGVSVKDIMRWNKLRSTRIYAGQKLVIYVSRNRLLKTSKTTIKKEQDETKQTNKNTREPYSGKYETYTVKEGDTLFDIAKNHGISLEKLMEVNNLSTDVIYPGQKIIIPLE